jgi:hypothetical protein
MMFGGAMAIFRATLSKLRESISGYLALLQMKTNGGDRVVRQPTVC